jgi:hypothetical protein
MRALKSGVANLYLRKDELLEGPRFFWPHITFDTKAVLIQRFQSLFHSGIWARDTRNIKL